jgi:hypothetical protein
MAVNRVSINTYTGSASWDREFAAWRHPDIAHADQNAGLGVKPRVSVAPYVAGLEL